MTGKQKTKGRTISRRAVKTPMITRSEGGMGGRAAEEADRGDRFNSSEKVQGGRRDGLIHHWTIKSSLNRSIHSQNESQSSHCRTCIHVGPKSRRPELDHNETYFKPDKYTDYPQARVEKNTRVRNQKDIFSDDRVPMLAAEHVPGYQVTN
jgi:hypothetical protein